MLENYKLERSLHIYKKILFSIMVGQKSQNKKILVSDGRFPDEIDMIKKYNGIIIKIERNNSYDLQHESESYISKIICDKVINNNGTIDDLESDIKKIITIAP